MNKKIIEFIKKEKVISILIIFIAAIIVCIPLLSEKTDITYDDGIQHICRLMGTSQSLQEGQPFATIMSNFCNGFGYSWNIFYSPITAFGPLIFKVIGMSYMSCIKIFMFVVVFLSGLSMYEFTKKVTKSNTVGVLSAVLYIFAPYRLTDMYIRNALAELTSFLFLPLIFNGLYNLLNKKKDKGYLLIFSTIGMILTHTIITVYTAIFAMIYCLINIKKLRNKNLLKKIIICILFILTITSFFWAPLLEHKNATQYEVFKEGRMERTQVLTAYKLNFDQLFITMEDSSMIYEIGLITLVGLIFTPFAIKRFKQKKYTRTKFFRIYVFMLISGIVCALMTLKIFPFEILPSFLKMIQFSFRLLEFSSFFFAFVVAINIGIIVKDFSLKKVAIIGIILTILTAFFIGHLHHIENFDENKLWPSVPVTSNTKRVHAGCASFEYLPSKAFNNRNYIENRSQNVEIISGNAQIENQNKQNSNMNFDIKFVSEETKLELPYIYYLGYEVTLKSNDSEIKINTYETDNGFIGITIPIVENGSIEVKYTGTFIMKFATFISILSTLVLIGEIYLNYRKDKLIKI